jgi:hypothetical protein
MNDLVDMPSVPSAPDVIMEDLHLPPPATTPPPCPDLPNETAGTPLPPPPPPEGYESLSKAVKELQDDLARMVGTLATTRQEVAYLTNIVEAISLREMAMRHLPQTPMSAGVGSTPFSFGPPPGGSQVTVANTIFQPDVWQSHGPSSAGPSRGTVPQTSANVPSASAIGGDPSRLFDSTSPERDTEV